MAEVRITKVSAIETAPMGSNLIVVRIDTNQSRPLWAWAAPPSPSGTRPW